MYTLGNLLEVRTYKLLCEATLKHLASPRHSKDKRVYVAYVTSLNLIYSAYDAESSVRSGTNQQQDSCVLLLIWGRKSPKSGIPALREQHMWDSYPRIKCLSITAMQTESLWEDVDTLRKTSLTHVHTSTLFKLQSAHVFAGVKLSFWSQQGRTVSIHSEHTPREPNRVLQLFPCTSLKWKEQRAMLLELLGWIQGFICPFASFCHHLEGKNRGWEGTRREKHHKSLTVLAGGWIGKPCSFSYLKLHPTCLSLSCRNNRPLER